MKPVGRPSFVALIAFTVAAAIGACAANPTIDVQRIPQQTDQTILAMLDHVTIENQRPQPAGYDRDCGTGNGCVFGHAWADVDGNGCDQRNDVLARQLTDVVFRPGSRCVVVAGQLRDPYTGALITFEKAKGGAIEIDHIYPLALAWDMGANAWPTDRRIEFANDQANLAATARAVNRTKSDKGPAEWLPKVAPTLQCTYAKRFLTVALGYKLPITKPDADAIRSTATHCS
jgi:hypothetical protein